MRFSSSWRAPLLLICLLGLVSTIAGCYTRLTTPKEAINFLSTDGTPMHVNAILAPRYNEVMREREAQGMTTGSAYRLQPGTRIRVEVWGHGISAALNIRPDGVVDLPLIGDVKAEGKTIPELKSEIATRYKEYYVEPPQIILNAEVNEQEESVKGGDVTVLQPGGGQGVVNLTGDEYLSQILADVGALDPKTEWNEIAVIRRGTENGERYIVVCDIEKLVREADLDQDLLMRNGDIVFVPREKNTLLEEIFFSVGVLADFVADVDRVWDIVDRVEAE